MEVLVENIAAYGAVFLLVAGIMYFYLRRGAKGTERTEQKIEKAKEGGLFEPLSLHPVVNHDMCIGSGACIEACPEKDILGIRNNQAVTINASRCVGHGACLRACPVQAIALYIGTEKRGVDLPHLSRDFESNIPMVFIAGELGGMGLIKNAVEQGKQATENLLSKLPRGANADYDVVIVGAGPAGVASVLTAKKRNARFLFLDQDTLGGAIYSFPRTKVIMTAPMDIPLYGKIKLTETTKTELLQLWREILQKNNITLHEQEKVEKVERKGDILTIKTTRRNITSLGVVLATGRRGTPRKLGVPGEATEKVFYRLLEPEHINNKNVLVVGGGDSAVEAALLLSETKNTVSVSYRGENFSRIKQQNLHRITQAGESGIVQLLFNSTVKQIHDDRVDIIVEQDKMLTLQNDLVYIFAGGELPTQFLASIGIAVSTKYGERISG
jgi:thioredoxin reductase/NAD-dependent dihydropyrimidine dehydrogenase PreA subunit